MSDEAVGAEYGAFTEAEAKHGAISRRGRGIALRSGDAKEVAFVCPVDAAGWVLPETFYSGEA